MSRDGGQMWDELKARAEAATAELEAEKEAHQSWKRAAFERGAKLNEVRMERDEERGCVSALEGIEEELRAKLAEVEGERDRESEAEEFSWNEANRAKHDLKRLRAGVEAEVERLRREAANEEGWGRGSIKRAFNATADRLSTLLERR